MSNVSHSSPASVLVVGGGPAGATLAHLLASRGVAVTLLERQRDFAREFRGEILLPSGLAALHEMGLDEVFAGVPRSVPDALELFANARPVLRLPLDPEVLGPHLPTAFSQPAFLEAVIEAAGRHPTFRVELGAHVVDLLRAHGRVVGVTVHGDGEPRELRADLVVGADGRTSVVRRKGGLEVGDQGVEVDVVWCKLPLPDFLAEAPAARAYVGRGHLLIAYRASDGRLQVAWVIAKGSYGELRRRGMEQWVEEMALHVTPDLATHLRARAGEISHPFLLSARADRVASWSVPGALVIGDAAHTMSPVGGQGINIALRDAVVAANHLVPVLRAGRDAGAPLPEALDAACRAVEAERTPELVRVQRMQALPPKVLMGSTWWGAALRRVVPHLLRSPFVRRRAAPVARTALHGVGEVRLSV